MEPITDVEPDILNEFRRFVNRQARMILAIARVERVSFSEVLQILNVSECDFRQFRAGRLNLTGHERLALGRRLKVHPNTIMDLGCSPTEMEFEEYEEWLNERSKWRKRD